MTVVHVYVLSISDNFTIQTTLGMLTPWLDWDESMTLRSGSANCFQVTGQ